MTHEHDQIVSQLIAATLNDQSNPVKDPLPGEHACNDINWAAYQRPQLTLKGTRHEQRNNPAQRS